jgi:hypothetical protein
VEVAKDFTFERREEEIFFLPVLEVPRQCTLVLLVEVRLRECDAVGNRKGKAGLLYMELISSNFRENL